MAMAGSGTMHDLQAPMGSWGAELKNYETIKRHAVDEGIVQNRQLRVTLGQCQSQERTFDPVLQRYRDREQEVKQRVAEERERVSHLNRAADIQILREQPFHIINHASKLESIAPGADPMRLGGMNRLGERHRRKEGQGTFPDTATTHNIISNLDIEKHHWAPHEERPRAVVKAPPKDRKVPSNQVRDFHVITNRYTEGHEAKVARDQHLRALEASHKYMNSTTGPWVRSKYDVIKQQCEDPRKEESLRVAEHAREVESVLRADALVPPAYKGRLSNHYNITSLEPKDKSMLKAWDVAEKARVARHGNRYIVEHNLHAQDVKADHINEARRMNRIAPERFQEPIKRGYDIIENKAWGQGPKDKPLYKNFTTDRLSPWQKIEAGHRVYGTGHLSESASAPQLRSASTLAPPAPAVPGGAASGGSVRSQARGTPSAA